MLLKFSLHIISQRRFFGMSELDIENILVLAPVNLSVLAVQLHGGTVGRSVVNNPPEKGSAVTRRFKGFL